MIANYLIIYRVADGRAWSSEMFSKAAGTLSSISFHGNSFFQNTQANDASEPTSSAMSDTQVRAISAPLGTLEISDDDASSGSRVDDAPKLAMGNRTSHPTSFNSKKVSWVSEGLV